MRSLTVTAMALVRHRCMVLGLLPALLFASCSVSAVAPGENPRPALPLPDEVEKRFDYAERGAPLTSWTCTKRSSHERYEIFEVKGEVTLRGDNAPISVEVEYWRSRGAPSPGPAVIVTPILGGGNEIARLMARSFAEEGLHGVIVWRGMKALRPEESEDEVERSLRRGVVSRRRVVDWLETLPEMDPERISAFGVSLGGIVTAALVPAEPRIHSAVIALTGGDLASIVMASNEPRCENYRKLREQAESIGPDDLCARLRTSLLSDPLKLAPFADPDRFLMFVARWDQTVPTRNQLLLRDALGKPRTFELPTTHYSALAFTPFLRAQSISWLQERMRLPNPRSAGLAALRAKKP